ncbi:MAG TPA: hypothetical protein PL000_23490 [Anaerolineales bacterium]|nr:hypothetical protein [Anaerolineales bacterium]
MRFVFAIASCTTLILQGCALFAKPMEKPVIEEKLNRSLTSSASIGTLSLTPERRVVLVNFANNRFCAEAPTETGIDMASLSDLVAKFNSGKADTPSGSAGITTALTSQNMAINKRTQGMQLFLANSYLACQMYMNGGIDQAQLLEMQFQTLKIVSPLIEKEIPYFYAKEARPIAEEKSAASGSDTLDKSIRGSAKTTVEKILDTRNAKPDEAPKPSPDGK